MERDGRAAAGQELGVSASYLGSYSDRLWAQTALNPGVFMGLGNLTRNAVVGPGYWNVDMGISRLIGVGTRRLELRVESFNVLNHFNWAIRRPTSTPGSSAASRRRPVRPGSCSSGSSTTSSMERPRA
jgi:hypothetical protein